MGGGGELSSGEKLILVLIHFLITCMHVSHSKEAVVIIIITTKKCKNP